MYRSVAQIYEPFRLEKVCKYEVHIYYDFLILGLKRHSKTHLAVSAHLRFDCIYNPAAKNQEKSQAQAKMYIESHFIDHSTLHSLTTHNTRSCQHKIRKNVLTSYTLLRAPLQTPTDTASAPYSFHQMCLSSLIKHHHFISQRKAAAATRKESKLEKNDHQRLNENLLNIALKRRTSGNSLTDRNPRKVAMEKKQAEERWWERT
jgi:hypothetical protein